jgi:hypothetical protein
MSFSKFLSQEIHGTPNLQLLRSDSETSFVICILKWGWSCREGLSPKSVESDTNSGQLVSELNCEQLGTFVIPRSKAGGL